MIYDISYGGPEARTLPNESLAVAKSTPHAIICMFDGARNAAKGI